MTGKGNSRAGKWMLLIGLLAFTPRLHAQGKDDTVLRAMKDEMARSLSQLRLEQMDKPYFLAYRSDDVTRKDIAASLGSLTSSSGDPYRNRLISVELRVGDYTLDNSNFFSMQRLRGGPGAMFLGGIAQGALDDDYGQIRRGFWLVTDRQYKNALEDLSAKKAALKMRNGGEAIPDFSKETPITLLEPAAATTVDFAELEALARSLSAVFRSAPEIERSSVDITYRSTYTRYVNSEGTVYTRSEPLIKLEVTARTQAQNGLPISDSFIVYGRTTGDLPSRETLLVRTQGMAEQIVKLRSASSLDRYNGPVLFEGAAAGELFVDQFAQRLAASRTPMSDNSQFEAFFNQMLERLVGSSFQDRLGARVLPAFISLRDDPAQARFGGSILMGNSAIDDDGVKTRGTLIIDHGILKNLLTSRVPVRGFLASSGSRHGGGAVPSNLFLTSEKSLSANDLKKELLRLAKERGLDYAIVVRHLGGGSESSLLEMAKQMARQGSSESIAEVYKVYADGHEEPLRGIHIAELPAESFKEIVATGEMPAVYSDELIGGVSALFGGGAFPGNYLPVVSCVTPSLLFEEVSLAKTDGPFPALPTSKSPLAEK